MELIKRIINGNEYTFSCISGDTRNGFKHVATLFKNCEEMTTGKCYYFNRTWESYRYQSACKQAVNMLIEETKRMLFENYKFENNLERLTKKRKENGSETLKEYEQLLESLKDSSLK